jgi:hypothetical protein
MLTTQQLIDIEVGTIATLQGGRITKYNDSQLCWLAGKHNTIGLYNGKRWVPVVPNTAPVVTLPAVTISGATLTSGVVYDVYAQYQSDTSFTFAFQEWASQTARYNDPTVPAGRFQGIAVYNPNTTSGQQLRYLGSVMLDGITGTPKFMDTYTQRFVVNYYNTKTMPVQTYNSSTTYYQYNTANQAWIEYGTGVPAILAAQVRGEFISIHKNMDIAGAITVQHGAILQYFGVGIGLNNLNPLLSYYWADEQDYSDNFPCVTSCYGTPRSGYNWITTVVSLKNDQSTNAPNTVMTVATPGDFGSGYLLVTV